MEAKLERKMKLAYISMQLFTRSFIADDAESFYTSAIPISRALMIVK